MLYTREDLQARTTAFNLYVERIKPWLLSSLRAAGTMEQQLYANGNTLVLLFELALIGSLATVSLTLMHLLLSDRLD
jgi:hypothetical protein